MKTVAFVREMFREYYNKDFYLGESFPMVEKREFGFVLFEGRMLRHVSFQNKEEIASFLRSSVPRDAYFSCAYYEDPKAEMEKKGWLGADLIFDIDADHIPTHCDKIHDEWTCGNCGFAGKGVTPEKCPRCGSEKFDERTWPCEVCLASAKAETVKLLDILTRDFGFSEKEIQVFFSGHRGYHIHVGSETIKNLDSISRKEIVDYICGLGLDVAFHGLSEKAWRSAYALKGLNLNDSGWRGRIAKSIYNLILNAKRDDYERMGLNRTIVEVIIKNKDKILKNLDDLGFWGVVKGMGFETWKKIAEFCVMSQSAKIDTVVTTDIHRLIRLAGTLHGKTGLKKVEIQVSDIEDFDPFKSAVAFKNGMVSVFVPDSPEFRLGDERFGPYKNQRVELPTAAAMLLLCKGRAEVVEQNV